MQVGDLDLVLEWRNHPEVRSCMRHQEEIGAAEHTRWFHAEAGNPDSHLLILEVAGVPSGYVKLTGLGDGSAEWGFYKAPGAPPGTGSLLGKSALRYAFESLGFAEVVGSVIATNRRSIAFHVKMGFVANEVPPPASSSADQEPTIGFRLTAERWGSRTSGGLCDAD
jgi:UDP-4-amino-4,6-dideoxy-N-acetyl-beta-L-altrosamine N-acetyltransferase